MDIERSKELMDILIENSARILRADFGVNYAEPAFFAVIDLVKKQPQLKGHLLALIASTLRENDPGLVDLDVGMIPSELIELLSHEMRWEELRALAEQRVREKYRGDWSFAVGDIARRIIDAQADDWPDREFYERYRAR